MWRVRNESTGKEVLYYEAELIDAIKAECSDKLTQSYDITDVTKRILNLINRYEKEGK